jgi:DNA ligase 1
MALYDGTVIPIDDEYELVVLDGGPETIEVGRRLYKVDSNGNMRVWFVEREGHKHRVVAGVEDGSLVTNAWTECKSKGKGKAQTTPEEQAIKEVEALYRKNLDRDYYETPEEARGPARNYLPMLAESYKDTTWEKWVARIAAEGFTPPAGETGVYWQPKLDGFCCIGKEDGLQSREGLTIVTVPHVEEALRPFFERYPGPVHGELYNHDYKEEFEKLSSILRKEKVTDEERALVEEKVQLHLYDYPGLEHLPFGLRSLELRRRLEETGVLESGVVHFVETVPVLDEAHLLKLTRTAINNGYEGGIGRLHLPYEKAKRSWSVTKIKYRMSAEFEVAAVEEGKGNYAGYAKRVLCWRPGTDRSAGITKANTFGAGIKGAKDSWLAGLLTAGHKIVTIEFFSYTMGGSGVPRQGVATKWHGDRRVL